MLRYVFMLFAWALWSEASLAQETKIIPSKTFAADCEIKAGKNVSYTPASGATYSGSTTNTPSGSVKIKFSYGLSKSGEVHSYTELTPVGFSNEKTFQKTIIDHLPLLSEKYFTVSSSVLDKSISLQRTYKNEWFGMLTVMQFQTDKANSRDQFVSFVYPLKCIGEVKV